MRYWQVFIALYLCSVNLWAADKAYGPVAKGETLWEITGNRNDKVSRYSVVLALLYENPKAFTVACNFNSLKLGAILYIPDGALITQIDTHAAVKEVKRQEKAWRNHRRGYKIKCGNTPLSDAWLQIKKSSLNAPKVLETLSELRDNDNNKAIPTNNSPATIDIPKPQPVIAQVPQQLPNEQTTSINTFSNTDRAHLLANLQWGVHLNTILISLNLGLTLFLGLLMWRSLRQHAHRLEDIHAHVERQTDTDEIAPQSLHRLFWLFWLFFSIGLSAFGGFMALVHKIQTQITKRHHLLSNQELMDGISLASFLPGSMAINLSAYVGFRLRGSIGALVCGIALLLPSLVLILALSYIYFEWGHLPLAKEAFISLVPAMTAIIFHAAWVLSYKAVQDPPTTLLAVAAAVILILFKGFFSSIIILLLAALAGILLFKSHISLVKTEPDTLTLPKQIQAELPQLSLIKRLLIGLALLLIPILFLISSGSSEQQATPLILFSHFLSFSLLSFGGGFTLIPIAQDILVSGHHWLSQTEFTAAITMGQLLPEILLSGVFMAYKLGGLSGALLAALALSLPTIFLTILLSQYFDMLKKSALMQAALFGIRAAIIGMIFATALLIGQTAILHWGSLLIFALAMFMLFHWHIEAIWVILLTIVIGMMVYSLPNIPLFSTVI